MVDHVVGNGRNELYLRVGGLISPTNEHVLWRGQRLKTGDEVRVKIVPTATISGTGTS
jgi:ABC-type iron transport system FetAB ATPase subunit